MNEVGEDSNEEDLLSLSDDEDIISNRLEEGILPLSQNSNDNRNRIEEIDWELNELEIEEEVEKEREDTDEVSGMIDSDMIDVIIDDVSEEEDEVLIIEEDQEQQQNSIDSSHSYSYDSPSQTEAEEEEHWNLCTQDNQLPSSLSPTSRLSTPEEDYLNRLNFSTPYTSSKTLEEISQSFSYNGPLIPSLSGEKEPLNNSPLNSQIVRRRSLIPTSSNTLLPLSTDRTNLFESQELEEEGSDIMDIDDDDDTDSIKGGSLPLLPRRLFSSEFTSSQSNLKRASSFNSISNVRYELDLPSTRPNTELSQNLIDDSNLITFNNESTKPRKSRKKPRLSKVSPLPSTQAPSSLTPTKSISMASHLASVPLIKERTVDPMQAEMDAFFGYLDPHRTLASSTPTSSLTPTLLNSISNRSDSKKHSDNDEKENSQTTSTRFSKEEKGKGKETIVASPTIDTTSSVKGVAVENSAKKSEEPHYQLQPIPTISSRTNSVLTDNEKRLAIIESLERLTLSILAQLVDSAIPPSPPPSFSMDSSNSTTVISAQDDVITSIADQDSQSQSQSQSSRSQTKSKSSRGSRPKIVAAWKPSPVIVVLAKRVDGNSYDPNDGESNKTKRLLFPRKNPGECGGPALARLLKVIELILDGLKRKVISTKRDIYYRSVKLFGNQARVDSLVEDIAATLKVRRCDLNIVAASKGLFGGFIKILGTDGIVREGGDQGCLIPPAQSIQNIEMVDVDWVLIIEKEAVFQSLCCPTFLEETENLGRGVLITGKGYPDVSTRELVHTISTLHPLIPLLCLVDSDPHGLEILSTYKFGSASLAFDNSNLAVSRVEWLGVKGTEWDEVGVDRDELLILNMMDRKKALGMLKRDWMPDDWKKELEYMLHLGRKAEIQVLSSAVASDPLLNGFLAELVHGESQDLRNDAEEKEGKGSRLFEYVARKIKARIA